MTDQLTFLSEEPPVNPSRSRDCEKDWMMTVATLHLNFVKFLEIGSRNGSFGKMCLGLYQAGVVSRQMKRLRNGEKTMTSPASLPDFGNAGISSHTEFLTLSISEWPKDADVCLLSDILETGDLPQRYFLSKRACTGILRRAENRGKELPPSLQAALENIAKGSEPSGQKVET